MNRKRKRRATFVAVLATLALVVAACTDGAAETDFGDIGGVVVPEGGGVRIAALQAISGSVANLGADQVRAIQIAIDDFGPIEGFPVFLSVEDDLCLSAGGNTGATRIVSDPQILGIVGTSCSGAAVPASEIMSEAGLVMISGSNTSPSLTSRGNLTGNPEKAESWSNGYFRVAHNDEFQGEGVAKFLSEFLGISTLATLHDGDPYTENLAAEVQSGFESAGGTIVFAGSVGKDDTDMRPVLTEVAAAAPEVLFFPIFQPAGDFIVLQAPDIAGFENIQLMGADGLLSQTYVTLPETLGMYFSGPSGKASAAYDALVAEYTVRNNEAPVQAFHAHAYDAVTLLLTKIAEVAEAQDDGTLHIDRQALRDALYATSGYEGMTGTLTCNEFGDCGAPGISVYQNADPEAGITGTMGNAVWP